jgi:hypothetical protein
MCRCCHMCRFVEADERAMELAAKADKWFKETCGVTCGIQVSLCDSSCDSPCDSSCDSVQQPM